MRSMLARSRAGRSAKHDDGGGVVILNNYPASDAVAIVKSDTVNQGPFMRIYVGSTGDVSLVTLAGNTVLFTAVPVGELRVGCVRVNSTNTTAANMVGLT